MAYMDDILGEKAEVRPKVIAASLPTDSDDLDSNHDQKQEDAAQEPSTSKQGEIIVEMFINADNCNTLYMSNSHTI